MRVRLWVVAAFPCWAGLVVAACTTDYQKGLEDPLYGDPNALAGKKHPGPTSEVIREDGTGKTSGPACVAEGRALADAGPCAVSFRSILAAFKGASCQTTGTCHGGNSNPPSIDPDDPEGTWLEFANFKLTNGKLYIDPCSTDPAASTIYCNSNLAASCGTRAMPPGIGMPDNVLADIDTWLKCGAPNN